MAGWGEIQNIVFNNLNVRSVPESFLQFWNEPVIFLNGNDIAGALCKFLGQCAGTGTDLNDGVV